MNGAPSVVLDYPWMVAAISLAGGGFVALVAGVLAGGLGFGAKVFMAAGIALVIFGCIYFFAPAGA